MQPDLIPSDVPEGMKRCPWVDHVGARVLQINQFGISHARKDGLNLYCRACNQRKVAQQRADRRERKRSRTNAGIQLGLTFQIQPQDLPFDKLVLKAMVKARPKATPAVRVKRAIAAGCRTQKAIAAETKLAKDELGDALAVLLLWEKEIVSKVVGGQRYYYLRTSGGVVTGDQFAESIKYEMVTVVQPKWRAA
jgi:hypothetical protein